MASYKLTYFDLKAVAEPIRLLFELTGVPYEDIRIPADKNWLKIKNDYSWGKLPVLEVKDKNGGVHRLTQSLTIGRYLAKTFNLIPEDEMLAVHCEEIVEAIMDLRLLWKPFILENDDNQKQVLKRDIMKEATFPTFLANFNAFIEKHEGPFLSGTKICWADLWMAHFMELFEDTLDEDLLEPYPYLKKQKIAVFDIPAIDIWLTKRPKTGI